jgi:hypothetical protein
MCEAHQHSKISILNVKKNILAAGFAAAACGERTQLGHSMKQERPSKGGSHDDSQPESPGFIYGEVQKNINPDYVAGFKRLRLYLPAQAALLQQRGGRDAADQSRHDQFETSCSLEATKRKGTSRHAESPGRP